MGLALTGTALAGGQAIAQAIPKTSPENLAPAPLKVPLPTPTPAPSATPVSEQPLVVVPIEPSSAPQAPPRARPTPRQTPAAAPPRREPEPRPTARAAPAVPTPPVAPAPAPAVTPAPLASPSAEPSSVATPVVVPATQSEAGEAWPGWLVPAVLAGLIALIAAFFVWRRRGVVETVAEEIAIAPLAPVPPEPVVPPPAPAPVPPEPAVPPLAPAPVPDAPQFLERPAPSERAWLDLAAPVVHRAGINLVTATADVALLVRNEGSAVARGVRLAIRLTSAQPGQDAVLDALFAEPVERPIVPPFDLAPGEERAVRGIATLPREAIVALTAAGRPMFVPVVALNLLYDAGAGTPGQTTAAFAIGVERPDGGKLGPLWLDEPARMHDAIGIRAHGTTVKR